MGELEQLIPRELPKYANRGDFLRTGRSFLRSSVALCGLRTEEQIFDVGCGVGRFAVPLTQYLSAKGSYDGLDVVEESIQWCRRTISSSHPNFRFHWADLYNRSYNPEGARNAARYAFAFRNNAFDFVFANSLFTHLLQDDTENYAHEMARVLRPGGRMLVTVFLLDDEANAQIAAGKSKTGWSLAHRNGPLRYELEDRPTAVVAYDEPYIRELFESCALNVTIHYGRWSGRREHHSEFGNKDILVLTKA